ncbi:hypothetical protein BBW65_06905 [Helicobacter enhydrae]|uniref:Uncharacterized protein n=1 Tax=Helicobacter enhydrae TaxID=222136 RepID=A0A1B1U6Z6_9HELI|nr:hypothetical protein BBW65_06905 [Helicobacter enhydrae]
MIVGSKNLQILIQEAQSITRCDNRFVCQCDRAKSGIIKPDSKKLDIALIQKLIIKRCIVCHKHIISDKCSKLPQNFFGTWSKPHILKPNPCDFFNHFRNHFHMHQMLKTPHHLSTTFAQNRTNLK